MSFDWKRFAIGAGLAALAGALTYAKALPSPYGEIATMLLVMLAHFTPTSLGKLHS